MILQTKDTIDPFFFFVPWQVMAIEIDSIATEVLLSWLCFNRELNTFFSLWSLCKATTRQQQRRARATLPGSSWRPPCHNHLIRAKGKPFLRTSSRRSSSIFFAGSEDGKAKKEGKAKGETQRGKEGNLRVLYSLVKCCGALNLL